MTYSDTDDTIRKRSGWLIPLGVFLVTLVLSAVILLYYLAPSAPSFIDEQVAPTSRTDIVALRVHGLKLWIPANYLEYESSRQGGANEGRGDVRAPARHGRLVQLGSRDVRRQQSQFTRRLHADPGRTPQSDRSRSACRASISPTSPTRRENRDHSV